MAIEKWLAITSVGLFAMFAGEMISVYYFMLTVPEDAVVAQGFTPDPKLIQFVSIGVAPAGIWLQLHILCRGIMVQNKLEV